jgi:hypothetical protein
MLDLFSDQPLDAVPSRPGDDLKAQYPWYDISALEKAPYIYGDAGGLGISIHSKGIRWQKLGTPNMLTKAALVRLERGVRLFVDWHHAVNVRLADVTCVLRHYPFTGTFLAKTEDAALTGRYGPSATSEYRQYHRVLRERPDLILKSSNARRLESVDQLVDEGFLQVSERYLEWVRSSAAPRQTLP